MSSTNIRALARALLDKCRMRKLIITTAESCTGGLVAAALTDIPGSRFWRGQPRDRDGDGGGCAGKG